MARRRRISQLLLHRQAIDTHGLEIEGRLPNGETIELAEYATELFDPATPRYITMKAMCGLPIRFVATTPQTNSRLWVIVKS